VFKGKNTALADKMKKLKSLVQFQFFSLVLSNAAEFKKTIA